MPCAVPHKNECGRSVACVHGVCDQGACDCSGTSWVFSPTTLACTAEFVCDNDTQCYHGNCSNNVCYCNAGWSTDIGTSLCSVCLSNEACIHGACSGGLCNCSSTSWIFSNTTLACTEQFVCDDNADCYHGICTDNACQCSADAGWGNDIATGLCSVCSSDVACVHGVCENGVCNCSSTSWGYSNATLACTVEPFICDTDDHCYYGTCSNNQCTCNTDRWIKDANTGLCTVCVNNAACVEGLCDSGVCNCSSSWWEYSNTTLACTDQPFVCSSDSQCYHGTCTSNVCVCDVDWANDVNTGLCTVCSLGTACEDGVCENGDCNCSNSVWEFSNATLSCTGSKPSILRGECFRRASFYLEGDGRVGAGTLPLEQTTARSQIGCAHACLRRNKCLSFHYHTDNSYLESECSLFEELLTVQELEPQGEYQYYRVWIP
ncbi:epidermal growth factor-like protein [Ptychodera flava]|uniref:epidermal growth factor-like protein n=1 Tax=Ptychodera flava TaxID=63121 RepID=UPI00396A1827